MPTTIELAQSDDLDAVFALLAESRLPLDGLADHVPTLLVARSGGQVIGSAALEMYGEHALLRSVAVHAGSRGRQHGRALLDAAIRLAHQHGVEDVYLLTTTAADYFLRLGFAPIARDDVPASVQKSVEFTTACPASATVMRKRVDL